MDWRKEMARARIRMLESAAQQAVCPVYGIEGYKAAPVGSGFLLRIKDDVFFITAAHVLHERHDCTLHIPGPGKPIPLEGTAYGTGLLRATMTPDFQHDLAFLQLKPDLHDQITGSRILTPEDLAVNDLKASGTLYGFVGFPAEINQPSSDRKLQRSSVYYGCQPAAKSAYDWLGYDERTHFVAEFDRSKVVDGRGRVVEGPSPRGMSGGPVWNLGKIPDAMAGRTKPAVIGVMIEWWEDKHWLVGLRAAFVTEAIRQIFTNLSDALPESRYFKAGVTVSEF